MVTQTSNVKMTKDSPMVVTPNSNKRPNSNNTSNKWKNGAIVSGITLALSLVTLLYNVPKLVNPNMSSNEGGTIAPLAGQLAQNLKIATASTDADASQKAYDALRKNLADMNTAMTSPSTNAPELTNTWAENQKKIQAILDNQKPLTQMNQFIVQLDTTIPELQKKYRQMVEKMLAANAPTNQVVIANNQVWLAEKIAHDITLLKSDTPIDMKVLMQDVQQFEATIDAQTTGTPAIQKVTDPAFLQNLIAIKQTFDKNLKPSLDAVVPLVSSNDQLRQQANQISQFTLKNTPNAITASQGGTSQKDLTLKLWLPLALLVLSLLSLLYFLSKLLSAKNSSQQAIIERETLRQRHEMEFESDRARKIQEENERNQMAILRLLDELGDLAEGDLTVNATVSEDFTGAIADSVNFAIDQLRQLVSAINVTAERVARASDQTQATAVELAEASENQAQEIAGASAAINEMAVSIDQVSANAAESATVADRSVAIAYNGAEVVQRTIDGMNTIRDQIQETSKRIKRLGESSQEIGDIVGLINDIADQTNILALNAAIQASMAGEAGRGFAVVADEVQRLAERSANATKQIEMLVKTIQADTNEAVMSMESTTAEVVRGARLAKDAGEALSEVQTVSNNLAQLIQSISNAARQQAASAGHISNTMNVIQDITSKTTSGTMDAARSIGQLNEMAAALQESVSGFKLPEDDMHHIPL